ncbi:WXG100 family type VII secretion target [Streptomyces sp. ODS28]|uniref:WXG100 family type VII secretion target n=1 Tax=Streptomyces sp. ODS28 TaxID=3136688 RepID=UPI0031E9740E
MSDSSANYDYVKLRVDPEDLREQAKKIAEHSRVIGEHLNTINSTLKELKLNWAGKSSEDFEDVTDRWQSVIHKIFGPEKTPEERKKDEENNEELSAEDGLLPVLASGVQKVADNYANADHNAKIMFDKMTGALNDMMERPESDPKDSLDKDNTAIGANYSTDFSEADKENMEREDRYANAGAEGSDLDAYVDYYGGVNTPDDQNKVSPLQEVDDAVADAVNGKT